MLTNGLLYEGDGHAEFGVPAIQTTGPAVVTVDARGTTTAVMQVVSFPSAASHEEGVHQIFRESFSGIARTSPCRLKVTCADGVFVSERQTFSNPHINLQESTASIGFQCFRGEYIQSESTPAHWRLPILNFNGDLRPVHRPPQIEHVMRMSHENPISPFEMFGEPGFIEYVPGFEELVAAQKTGDSTPRITAAMVGSMGGHGAGWEELRTWFPFDFLNLVGFASGGRVGAPWIEFFDEQGKLLRRTHVQLGTTQLQRGDEFMNDVIHRGGLGHLLTRAANSAEFQKSYFRVAMNHLLLGVPDSQALEDKISHLSRALEGLATEFGFDQQYLLEGAADEVKDAVKNALRNASGEIIKLASEQDVIGRSTVAASLRKIAERTTSNPANIDRDFGLSVLSLLDRFRLHDAAVVEAYYAKNPRPDGRKWHQVLSHYRGLSQHGDAFQFEEGKHSAVEVLRLASHLADIVARILLIQLGYDGEYQRATATWRDVKGTDWVTPTTPPIELGYGRDAD